MKRAMLVVVALGAGSAALVAGCGGDAFTAPPAATGGATGAAGTTGAGGSAGGGSAGATAGGGAPADVGGTYSLALKNGPNGCNFANWTVDQTATNVPFVIAQTGGNVTGMLTGGTAALFELWLGKGASNFTGTISGNQLSMTSFGTNQSKMMSCSYTFNAVVTATATGDTVQGKIDYAAQTNGSPDCTSAGVQGCATMQSFSGSRPPK